MQVISICVWFFVVATSSVLFSIRPDTSTRTAKIEEEHARLPPVYDFDSLGECFYGAKKSSVYCVTKTFVDPGNELWIVIQKSKGHRHFNREVISHGICIEKCAELLNTFLPSHLSNSTMNREIFQFGDKSIHSQYHSMVEQCINLNLQKYGGSGQAKIEYCTSDAGEPFDTLDFVFVIVVVGILVATVSSTLYDYYGGKTLILRSFSLITNWAKFTRAPGAEDLVFLDCLKVLMQVLNLAGHIYYLLVSNPHRNSIFFEVDRYSIFMRIGMGINFTNFIFFTISGYLLASKEVDKDARLTDLVRGFKDRYFRLTPLLAFTILLHSTWAPKIFSGPVWAYMAGREKAFCRKNYWTNLLFINNFVNLETACLLPTWYLANDLQLFVLKDVIFIVISYFRKYRYFILNSLVLTSLVILYQIAAATGINGVYIPSMEASRSFTREDSQFNAFLKPVYTNFGCYVFGLLIAFVDFDVQQSKTKLKESTCFQCLWHSLVPLIFSLVSASYVFDTYTVPVVVRTSSGALYRVLWSVVICILILGFRNRFGGNFVKDLMNASGWRRLAKVNYCVLMSHIFTYQLLMGGAMSIGLIEMSLGFFGTMIVIMVGASYAIAVIFYMLIELPAANLLKCF